MRLYDVAARPSRLVGSRISQAFHQRRTKTFHRVVSEDGEPLFHVARQEDKQQPLKPRPEDLFTMPDVVLDLDMQGRSGVREFGWADEQKFLEQWRESPKRAQVRSELTAFSKEIEMSRERAGKVLSDPTNPWRITDHDILSVALRGFMPSNTLMSEDRKGLWQEKQPVTTLSQSRLDEADIQAARAAAEPAKLETEATEAGGAKLVHDTKSQSQRGMLLHLDPRQEPDVLHEVASRNGIPRSVVWSDERLLRWMITRRINLDYAKHKSAEQPPSTAKMNVALRQHILRRSNPELNFNIARRIVSQCLEAGTDITTKEEDAGRAASIFKAIQDICLATNHRHSEKAPRHAELLTFSTALESRFPTPDPDMRACIFHLRLVSLSGLGWLERTADHIQGGHTSQTWFGMPRIPEGLKLALEYWNNHAQEDVFLNDLPSRQLLLRTLTGVGEDGSTSEFSFRSMILRQQKGRSPSSHLERLEAFGSYIRLLGQLGAVRTLWKEWTTTVPDLKALVMDKGRWNEDVARGLASTFWDAIASSLYANETVDVDVGSLSWEDCAQYDHDCIRPRIQSSECSGGKKVSQEQKKLQKVELLELLRIPVDEWMTKAQELCASRRPGFVA
jgi:hypothetical protein